MIFQERDIPAMIAQEKPKVPTQEVFIPTAEQEILMKQLDDITTNNERTKRADEIFAQWIATLKTEDELKNIPLTNRVGYSTDIPDFEERTEAVREIFFQKEAYCVIPEATVKEIYQGEIQKRACPSDNFQKKSIQIQNTH